MSQSSDLGKEGEDRAAKYLEENGFRILHRNWKSGKNEIDIIAEIKDYIVFTEVKTRVDGYFEPPKNAVTREKQRSIIWAADAYLNRHSIDKECRFDVITLIKKADDFEIEHIPDAFYPTLR